MDYGICAGCQKPIRVSAPYERVRGYRRFRSGGGPNQITCALPIGEWMDPSCVAILKTEIRKGYRTIATSEPEDACHICRGALGHDCYEEVECLRRQRSDGGANQATAAQATGKRACARCIEDMRKGRPVGQQALL